MRAITWFPRRSLIVALLGFLGIALLLAPIASAGERIVLPRHPTLKIGFTTVNFMKQMPLNLTNAKKWVDFAAEQGFAWIELRDPTASLALAECKELATYAKQRGIEVGYALAVGLLDPNFWEVFSRGIANAVVFDGPRTIRTAGPGLEFASDPKKTAWTLAEFAKVVEGANQAANLAKMFGLQHVVENALEVLKGDGVTSFGTTELFANVNGNVGYQLDTGNFFAVARVPAKPGDAQAFLEKHIGKMGYMHLKTATKDLKATEVLAESLLIFEIPFWLAMKNKKPYVAIELVQPNTLEEAYANHKKSVEYLLENF